MSIIKRVKTSKYTQVHNEPLQTLEDLRSIGLLAYLLSLPENWIVQKTQLYNKFGRAAVTNAIKELESKGYWVAFKIRNGKFNEHMYYVSDQPFQNDEVKELIAEIETSFTIYEINPFFQKLLPPKKNEKSEKERNTVVSSIAQNEQLNVNYSEDTYTKEIKTKEIKTKKDIKNQKLVNKENVNKENSSDKLILEYRKKGMSQELCERVLAEAKAADQTKSIKNFNGYLRTCLENTLHRSKIKHDENYLSDINNSIIDLLGTNYGDTLRE